MGRIRRKIMMVCLTVLAWVFLCPIQEVQAQTKEIQIEQAKINMPELKIFVTGDESLQEMDNQSVTVTMGEREFPVTSIEDFDRNEERIDYYFLLDVSASMDMEYYQAACEIIADQMESLTDSETYKVLTFGDSVELVLEDEYDRNAVDTVLAGISNEDENTQLFEALKKAAQLAEQREDKEPCRKIIMIFTDGMDDVTGMTTVSEAQEILAESGMTVYGMAADCGESESINQFGAFIRETGGQMEIYGERDAKAAAEDIWSVIENTKVIYAEGDSNQVTNRMETVTVQFEPWDIKREARTGCYDYIPDQESPQILSCSQMEKNCLQITFSEKMSGADTEGNYRMVSSAGEYIPDAVTVIDDSTVQLHFEESLYSGEYTLETMNMTDCSMEQNAVKPYENTVMIEGREPEPVWSRFIRIWGLPLLCVLVVLIFMAAAFFIYRHIRKNRGLIVVDGKMTLASKVDVRQHMAIEDDGRPGALITLEVTTIDGQKECVMRKLSDSMMIGRSEMCDIVLDDARMSSQHFALEYEKGQIFITDLETTNGTSVNGVRLKGKYRLQKGDKIHAGSMDMFIQWENIK